MKFKLVSPFKPTGDQPRAIEKLTKGLNSGFKHQALLGVTGSGKTFTVANVIAKVNRPTLVVSPNKTLAAQLFQEFKSFFPENSVHYFISYYDYYQPEAYLPQTDTYIEKDAKINEEIDRLRHAATASLLTRRDIIVVASVSCIYNIGDPQEYAAISLEIARQERMAERELTQHLVNLQYLRNDYDPKRGEFRLRGGRLEIMLPAGEEKINITFSKNLVKKITRQNPLLPKLGNQEEDIEKVKIFPAKHFVTPQPKLALALANIRAELTQRLNELNATGKLLEAERLERRTNFDLEMLRQTGYCPGIENYSRHLSFREPGFPPFTLLNYFPDDFITVIDESHIAIPQLHGMYEGDRARKKILIEYGFRLPSALDNRPLKFGEFETRVGQTIHTSATPGFWEVEKSGKSGLVEQLIRPTGLLDPKINVRPTTHQVQDLCNEVAKAIKNGERVLILTLTKRLAEELAGFLTEKGIRTHWLHSEVKTLERPERLAELRSGDVDVMVGINLLREGLDLPEVALVAILDADKEGYLRSARSIIQMMGRASRHERGRVILYADAITKSMREAITETQRRRLKQRRWNAVRGMKPQSVKKEIRKPIIENSAHGPTKEIDAAISAEHQIIAFLRKAMQEAAKRLDFERAAEIRNKIKRLQSQKV